MTTGVNVIKLFFFVTNALMTVRKALQPSLIFVNKFINLPLRLSGTCGLYYKNLEHYLLSSITLLGSSIMLFDSSIMLFESSIMLFGSSVTFLDKIYSTGITHDKCYVMIVICL